MIADVADVIRVSMPLVELAILLGVTFVAGFVLGIWARW